MTSEEVRAAAEFVQANEFIEKLPDKYAQKVTERGSTFSSGQRQLVAFARTIATNPKILVLMKQRPISTQKQKWQFGTKP